ncbi:hypothetical protein [Wukongibacter baidiensis]
MKTNLKSLISEIAEDLIIYMKSGKLEPMTFLKDLDINVHNFDQLLKIHFLLKQEVKEFVLELPKMIRKFRTSTSKSSRTLRSEIKGQIDWKKNTQLRSNSSDDSLFACNESNKYYNIKENLVLKELLDTLYNILLHDINYKKFIQYDWFKDWKELNNIISKIYLKNVYISRIRSEKTVVTDRMINDTLKHRTPLYRKAAQLLASYRKLMRYDISPEEARELLEKTFILPSKEGTCFELYWVMNLIRANTEYKQLRIIDGSNNLVASWEDDHHKYEIFHDSIGSRRIQFNVPFDEVAVSNSDYLNRRVASRKSSSELIKAIFSRDTNSMFWSGRPDIILEISDKITNKLNKVVLGEVKYTNNSQYASQGLQELFNYIMLAKNGTDYLFDSAENQVEVEGILFLDNIKINEYTSDVIKVVTTNDKSKLKINME